MRQILNLRPDCQELPLSQEYQSGARNTLKQPRTLQSFEEHELLDLKVEGKFEEGVFR